VEWLWHHVWTTVVSVAEGVRSWSVPHFPTRFSECRGQVAAMSAQFPGASSRTQSNRLRHHPPLPSSGVFSTSSSSSSCSNPCAWASACEGYRRHRRHPMTAVHPWHAAQVDALLRYAPQPTRTTHLFSSTNPSQRMICKCAEN
jgi:hypothetical protein